MGKLDSWGEGRGEVQFAGSGMENKYLKNAGNKTVSTTGLAAQPLRETNIFKANRIAPDRSAKTVQKGHQENIICLECLSPQLRIRGTMGILLVLSFKMWAPNSLLDLGVRIKPQNNNLKKWVSE